MSTLYISDLDGTLLRSDKSISPKTISIINRLTKQGLLFSLATARGLISVEYMIRALELRLPIIIMNGVFVYDLYKNENILENYLENGTALKMINTFESFGILPWVYAIDEDGSEKVFYRCLGNTCQEAFLEERLMMGDRRYHIVSKYPDLSKMKITHLFTMALQEDLDPLYVSIKGDNELFVNYYEDVYQKGYFLIEIMNPKATKREGLIFLKEYLGADKVVAFGDNLNDIPMFEAADECYAVENAHKSLIAVADGVIDSNNEDGVARFIQKQYLEGQL